METSLSTVEVASNNAKKLNEEFVNYFNTKNLKYKNIKATYYRDSKLFIVSQNKVFVLDENGNVYFADYFCGRPPVYEPEGPGSYIFDYNNWEFVKVS